MSYTVNSLADVVATDGVITLREALQAANTNAPVCDAPAGSTTETDLITFASGGTITLGGTQLEITDDVDIQGLGADLLRIDAASHSRVFCVTNSCTATISGLRITGGSADYGGGIYKESGALTLSDSILSGNSAQYGGGIYNKYDTVTVTNSILSGNQAHGTTSENSGGGIYNEYGTVTVGNSTLTGNAADYAGGGILTQSGTLTIVNSIVALNTASRDQNVYGSITPGSGFNLIGVDPLFVDFKDSTEIGPGGDGVWGTADDVLADLRLTDPSPAIDAGSNALLPVDSQDLNGDGNASEAPPIDLDGNPRVIYTTVDIGAYEYWLAGDLNTDRYVGGGDLDIVRANWGQNVTPRDWLQGDASGDGVVGAADLDIVRAHWGAGTPPGADDGDNHSATPADACLPQEAIPASARLPDSAQPSQTPLASAAVEDQVSASWQTIFSDGFEGAFPGSWQLYGDPTWKNTSYSAHTGSWSAYCVGSAVNPPGPYPNNADAWIVYGPFSLADATDAKMDFYYRNKSKSGSDYFQWFASTDGMNFYGYHISGNQNTWRSQSFDLKTVPTLGNLCGQGQVWIAFHFMSDASLTDIGAFVDDVVISKYAEAGPASWVVAYYLANGNNLDTFQTAKFSAIANGASNSNVQCVVLYDYLGTTQDAVYQMTAGLTSPSSYTRNVNMWWSSDIGLGSELNMGDGATLSTFMNWVVDHYTADHYALVLFDHGDGWESTAALCGGLQATPLGVCWDGTDYLTTAELGTAFAAIDNHRGANIEVTYFDACLMQMIEVAYQIRNNTDFIVGNENLGWVTSPSYEANYLGDITATTSPLALAVDIATQCHNWEASWALPHAVSVVDTSQMTNVYDALQTLGTSLLAAMATPTQPTDVDHFAEIRAARTNVQKFDENGNDVLDAADAYVDLKHFAQRLEVDVVGSDPAAVNLRAAAQSLEDAMGSSYIRYFAQTSGTGGGCTYDFSNAHGQSIYLPQNTSHGWLSYYNATTLGFCNGNWDEFLDAYLPADLTAPYATSQSTTVTEGEPFWIEFTIENRGSTTAGASYVRAYLSTDNDLDTSDDYALPVQSVGSLGPGQSTTIRWDFTMPDLGSGSYPVWMVAKVDYNNNVSEYYEDNTWKISDAFTAQDQATPPEIGGLPDVALDEDNSLDNAIDLWAYTSDAETPNNELLFEIVGNTAPACGVSIDSNRYIDIDPAANWYGVSDVTIRVTDPTQLTDTDTFRITVNSVNDPPVVVGLEDTPDPVTPTWTLTLTATGVADPADPTGFVTKVLFYRESNGQPGLQVGADTLVATDESPDGGWSVGIPTIYLPKGTYIYYAQAEDNGGLRSSVGMSAPTTTNTVSPIAGDLNSDGFVSGADLDIIRAHWGQHVTSGDWSQGDCAPSGGDGLVSGADLDMVRSHWGQSAPPAPPSTAIVVEETVAAPIAASTSEQAMVQTSSARLATGITLPPTKTSSPKAAKAATSQVPIDQQTLVQITWAYQQEQGRLRKRLQRGSSRHALTDLVLSGWLS